MEVKKIVEGMTAVEVAEVIDNNFKNQNKILEEDIAKQNNVIGVSEYKDFSEAEAVSVGDVRKYNGLLYECVEATTGAFDASKWKKSSFKAETEKKLSELGSEMRKELASLIDDEVNYKELIVQPDDGENVELDGYYVGKQYTPVADANWKVTKWIDVSEIVGETIYYKSGAPSALNTGSCCLYASDKQTGVGYWVGTTGNRSIVIPEGAHYARASFYKSGTYSLTYNGEDMTSSSDSSEPVYKVTHIKEVIDGLATQVKELEQLKQVDFSTRVFDGYLDSSGTPIANSEWIYTDYINVNGSVKYRGGMQGKGNIIMYDDGKNVIGYYGATDAVRSLSMAEGTRYVRASFYKAGTYSLTDTVGNNLVEGKRAISEQVSVNSSAIMEMQEVTDTLAAGGDVEKPWVTAERQRIENFLMSKVGHDIVVWGFNSDQHIYADRMLASRKYPVVRGLNAMRRMADNFPFDILVLGGDEIEDTNYEEGVTSMMLVMNEAYTDACPVIGIGGNHDGGKNFSEPAGSPENVYEWNIKVKRMWQKRLIDKTYRNGTNCYFDNEATKVRFLFLDPYGGKPNADCLNIIDDALSDAFLISDAWSVVIFSHAVVKTNLGTIGINTNDTIVYASIWDKIEGYIDQGVNVELCVCGHTHYDNFAIYGDTLFVATTCARAYGSDSNANYGYNKIEGVRVRNTWQETAFDVYVWDRTEALLYTMRYGSGADRVFNMATGSKGLISDTPREEIV